ncbi:MAG: flagellar hook-length control protein FliK, partial [Roseibium sp.]|uniref:flagellar hook-length control protein FliK n=1 Tax=Roseibium sp. TaxID=1936156 RepID=UPI00260E49BD
MSLNTHPLVQVPAKSGKPAGGSGEAGDTLSCDTAAKFQSVLKGMKNGEGPVSEDGKKDTSKATTQNGSEQGVGQKLQTEVTIGESSAEGSNGSVAFATSNLTDALRKASRNVLGQGEKGEILGDTEPGPKNEKGGSTAQAPATFTRLSADPVIGAQARIHDIRASSENARNQSVSDSSNQSAKTPGPLGKADLSNVTNTGTSSLFAQFGIEPETVGDTPSARSAGGLHLPDEAAGNVKVLRQETHFAPNMRLSPAQQVGDQVATYLKEAAVGNSVQQSGLSTRAEGPVLKTLDIQLTPHELGSVKVSLRMVGESVEVTLLTSKAQTAELLKQDRQLLDQMLRTTGFKADTITVQSVDDRVSIQSGQS